MRRLDLHPEKKLRGAARQERRFFRAMDGLAGWFPAPEEMERGFAAVKLPVQAKAVSPRHARPGFREAVVARLVEVAGEVARRKPAGSSARVAAILEWPLLWGSELCVFADGAAAHGHAPEVRAALGFARTDWQGGWIEASAPEEDLLARTGAMLPPGFAAHGTHLRSFDRDTGLTLDSEEWVVMEIAA